MVHAAAAFAKSSFRLRTMVCTSSIGPGATNMLTGAALATINRLPVFYYRAICLPGATWRRSCSIGIVLSQDISVNDCFKPVSRYWDRIQRPEQVLTALPEAMRVLTSPVETGAVTLCLPQDVQAEAFDCPEEFLRKRVWSIARNRCDPSLMKRAAEWIRAAKSPLIVAGGGVLYSGASEALAKFAQATGIPVCETNAGKGSLPFDHTQNVGAVGVTGTPGQISLRARLAWSLALELVIRISPLHRKLRFKILECASLTSTSASSIPINTRQLRLRGCAYHDRRVAA